VLFYGRLDKENSRDTIGDYVLCAMLGGYLAGPNGPGSFGCLKKIIHGVGTAKNCTSNHTEAGLAKTASEIGEHCTNYL
jgi:hypothetical protein